MISYRMGQYLDFPYKSPKIDLIHCMIKLLTSLDVLKQIRLKRTKKDPWLMIPQSPLFLMVAEQQ